MEDTLIHPFVEKCWEWLITTYSFQGVFVFFFAGLAILYLSFAGLFGLFDYFHLFPQYKIKGPENTAADYKRALLNLGQNYVLIMLPMGYLTIPYAQYFGMEYSLPLPSWTSYWSHIAIFFVLEDFLHYWAHRALHLPWIYPKIHKLHHYYASPFGLSANYAHPLEVIILGMCTFLPALVFRPHWFTFYTWFILRQLDAVITHSGYSFPLPMDLIPGYGGTAFHDYHHKSFIYNFGSRFEVFDKLAGTYREPPLPPAYEKKENKSKST